MLSRHLIIFGRDNSSAFLMDDEVMVEFGSALFCALVGKVLCTTDGTRLIRRSGVRLVSRLKKETIVDCGRPHTEKKP